MAATPEHYRLASSPFLYARFPPTGRKQRSRTFSGVASFFVCKLLIRSSAAPLYRFRRNIQQERSFTIALPLYITFNDAHRLVRRQLGAHHIRNSPLWCHTLQSASYLLVVAVHNTVIAVSLRDFTPGKEAACRSSSPPRRFILHFLHEPYSRSSFCHVSFPTMPSALRWLRTWNAITAPRVAPPKSPSAP